MPHNEGSAFQFRQLFVSAIELERIVGFSCGTWQKPRLLSHAPRFDRMDGVVRYDSTQFCPRYRARRHLSEHAVNRDRLTLILAGRSVGFRVSGVYR